MWFIWQKTTRRSKFVVWKSNFRNWRWNIKCRNVFKISKSTIFRRWRHIEIMIKNKIVDYRLEILMNSNDTIISNIFEKIIRRFTINFCDNCSFRKIIEKFCIDSFCFTKWFAYRQTKINCNYDIENLNIFDNEFCDSLIIEKKNCRMTNVNSIVWSKKMNCWKFLLTTKKFNLN